jgi:hypothetical protein
VLRALEHPRGYRSRGDDPPVAVGVGDEGVQRPDALDQSGGQLLPLDDLEQTRDRVDHERLVPLAGAKLHAAHRDRPLDVRAQRLEVGLRQCGHQLRVVRPGPTGLLEGLVEEGGVGVVVGEGRGRGALAHRAHRPRLGGGRPPATNA